MVDYQTLSIVLTGLGIIVAIIYYTLTVRNSTKARQAQVYAQIWDKFSSPEFFEIYFETLAREWTDFDDYMEKYGGFRTSDPRHYARYVSLGAYFEGIGVLLKHGYIDIRLVVDLLGGPMISFWEKMGPLMEEYRVKRNSPRAYIYAEYLYNQIKPLVEKEHPELKT